MKSHNPRISPSGPGPSCCPQKQLIFDTKGVYSCERECACCPQTADSSQRDKLRWGTFCLKLNKGSPFRTTILYVLLHTIFMCLKIFTWWTWMCQLVLVTGPSLNTQLRNHPSSWFVYKVCAMHAGVCVWGYSLHRPNHSEIGTSIVRYPCCILLTGMTIFTLQPTGGTTGSTSRLLTWKGPS